MGTVQWSPQKIQWAGDTSSSAPWACLFASPPSVWEIEDSRASLLINKSPFICRRPPGAAAGAEAASRGGALPPRGDSRRLRVLAKGWRAIPIPTKAPQLRAARPQQLELPTVCCMKQRSQIRAHKEVWNLKACSSVSHYSVLGKIWSWIFNRKAAKHLELQIFFSRIKVLSSAPTGWRANSTQLLGKHSGHSTEPCMPSGAVEQSQYLDSLHILCLLMVSTTFSQGALIFQDVHM